MNVFLNCSFKIVSHLQLNKQITLYNLTEIAKKLRETAAQIPSGAEMSDVRTSLRNQALHLATYQENLVDPMTRDTLEMMELTTKLDESFKFNKTSFDDGIDSILLEIAKAKDFIDNQATGFVKNVSFKFKDRERERERTYANRSSCFRFLINCLTVSFWKSIHTLH